MVGKMWELVKRAMCVGIVISLSIVAVLLIPLYEVISAQGQLVVVSPLLTEQELVRVLEGPDPNATYLQLQAGQYEIVDAPQKYIYRVEGEVIVQMEGFLLDDSPGDPALPYQVYRIALPPEAVVNSLQVEVIHLAETELPEEYRVAPAPPYMLDQEVPTEEEIRWEFTKWGVGKEIVEGHNILIYEKDTFYPAEYCQVDPGGQLRKWKAATVVYYPVRYNPVKSKLVVAEEIALKISFDRDYTCLRQEKTKQLLRDDTFDELAEKLFLNYDRAKDWYLKPFYEGSLGDPKDPNYTIITTEDIFDNTVALDDFCFHKQDLGFTVIVVTEHETHTVDGVSGSYFFADALGGYEDVVGDPPNQRDEKIRQWLIDNYLALGIEYVLLIGNPDPDNIEPDDLVGDVPMQLCWTSLLDDYPTDIYFSDLSGDWNLDDDDYVGEWYSAAGYSNLPAGVTGNLFCVCWEGVVEVAGATDLVNVKIYGYTEGQTTIWFDKDQDGFTDSDIILEDTLEHHPEYRYAWVNNLADGHYPIRINYTQSNGDAYCDLYNRTSVLGVKAAFKHDDGMGNYVDGLEADYFNDNDFSAPPDVEQLDSRPNVRFIAGGDRGAGGVDFLPEVILGRIPFYGEDENDDGIPDYGILDGILTKIINYENADIHEETWRRRVLISTPYMYEDPDTGLYTVADYEGGETLMDNIAPPPLWEWYRIHEEDYPDVFPDAEVNTGCSVNAMVAGWNDPVDPDDGRGVVMWRTHGSQTGAAYVFDETHCANLDDSKPSIVIQTTCQNGQPEVTEDLAGVKHYPLGYSLLKQGAIATICSSRNSAGGVFDRNSINIAKKNNPYLLYFLAKGIFYNVNIGDVLAHVRVNDATLGYLWSQIFNYNLYGDPSLSLFGADAKSNNDMVFLLDGSGSMLSEGKWDAAVDATVLFYELMEELRHPAFKDRYNSVVFRWIAGADASTTIPPGTGLRDISIPLTTATLNAETPESYYCTPIGEGLILAINQFDFDSEESFYSNKAVLLLSDGKQNQGTDPLAVDIPEEVKVYAVGLGDDFIEPETIEDIAYGAGGDFIISPTPRDMADFFCQIFCDTSWKLQDVTVTTNTNYGTVAIDQSKAVFIVVWDDPATSLTFDLDPPGAGPNITATEYHMAYPPMEVTYHAPAAGETHAFYVCENIPSELLGEWNIVNINDGATAVPLNDVLLKVIEDPQTIADFDIENIDRYTGQPIMLTAKITEDGKSKVGLSEVYAELIRSPAQAVGTLMAENTPPPDYPPQPTDKDPDCTLRSHYLLGVMEKLSIENLTKVGGPRINLRDDGLGLDLKANDGIYTGVFNETNYEGSYTFKFRARGTNSDGVTFDRTATLSKYVKFTASPTETKVQFVSKVTDQQEKTVTATIRVTPRDESGSYLGPFSGDRIRLWSSSGQFNSSYEDNEDGSYTFTLVYPIDTDPLVSVSVGNIIVAEQAPVQVEEEGIPIWVFLILLLLVLLILVIYLYFRRK